MVAKTIFIDGPFSCCFRVFIYVWELLGSAHYMFQGSTMIQQPLIKIFLSCWANDEICSRRVNTSIHIALSKRLVSILTCTSDILFFPAKLLLLLCDNKSLSALIICQHELYRLWKMRLDACNKRMSTCWIAFSNAKYMLGALISSQPVSWKGKYQQNIYLTYNVLIL